MRILVLLLAIALAACSSEPGQTASRPEADFKRFADDLVSRSGRDLYSPEYARETGYKPPSFILRFHTDNPDLLSRPNADNDKAAYEANLRNTAAWERMFCNSELKSIMQTHQIFLVSGHLLNNQGQVQALAPCML